MVARRAREVGKSGGKELKTHRTLLIWADRLGALEHLAEDLAGAYNDNGDLPDGNALLPSVPIAEKEASMVRLHGGGIMISATYADDDEMIKFLNVVEVPDEWDDDLIDRVNGLLSKKSRLWAHYGAYGCGIYVFT